MPKEKKAIKTKAKRKLKEIEQKLPGFYPNELEDLSSGVKERYTFVSEIGKGKTGVAYKLKSKANEYHYVCIKTISPTIVSRSERKRVRESLEKEVEILKKLDHRCLPQIYEYDINENLPYYICSYHPGLSLRKFKEEGKKLRIEESVFVISSFMDVLAYLHSEGRTHCDLHWDNVLLSEDVLKNGILIVDFGAGHRESDSSPVTPNGGLVNLKDTPHQGGYRDKVNRFDKSEVFRSYDFRALGKLLAQMKTCFFSDALPDQENAYIDFCNLLTQGIISTWKEAKEKFLRVIDPYRIISAARRLFMSSEYYNQTIPLPVWQGVPVGDAILAVINTATYQRLRQIKQLSFCDWYFPGANHTRFEHSLGVFAAAKKAVDTLVHNEEFRKKFNEENIQAFLLAALVHDIGHYPFTHVIEQYVASRFPDEEVVRDSVSHAQNVLDILKTDTELMKAICSSWGEGVLEQAIVILDNKMPVLSDLINGPIDCDKIDYLCRDAWHCGIAYGQGLDYRLLLNSFCCVQQSTQLGVTRDGVSAVGGLMVLQDQMLSEVYWHKYSRAVICMFHAVLAAIIGKDDEKLRRLVSRLKQCQSEELAIRKIIIPEIEELKGEQRKSQIRKLFNMHVKPKFTDIYQGIAEYKETDTPPTFTHIAGNIYGKIISKPSQSATSVPVAWKNVQLLREAYKKALKEKNIEMNDFELVVDVPFGKTQHRQIFVRGESGGPDIPIVEVSHLKPSIFTDPAMFLSPIRIYIAPAIYERIRFQLDSVKKSAEERFYKPQSV